jgi:nitric oxide reductase NorD protein
MVDSYDRSGLQSAMAVIRDLEGFLAVGHQRAAGSLYEDAVPILLPFLQGLEGRRLKIEAGEFAWTDGEVIYLPEIIARLDNRADNFQLFKAIATQLWAQTRYGTLNVNLMEFCGSFADSERALAVFRSLETLRLDTRIAAELPGLFRRMRALSTVLGDATLSDDWQRAARDLARREATVQDSLHWIGRLYEAGAPPQRCYQGGLNPEAAWSARLRRIERDKARLRESLRVIAEEIAESRLDQAPPSKFELQETQDSEQTGPLHIEVTLAEQPLPIPDRVREQLVSILLDLGDIPPEYLTPAGEGEYDASLIEEQTLNPEEVWGALTMKRGRSCTTNGMSPARHTRKTGACCGRSMSYPVIPPSITRPWASTPASCARCAAPSRSCAARTECSDGKAMETTSISMPWSRPGVTCIWVWR